MSTVTMTPRERVPLDVRAAACVNRIRTRPFLLASMPKAGTHLLMKLLLHLPGVEEVPLNPWTHFPRQGDPNADQPVPLGVSYPRPVSGAGLRYLLGSIRRAQFGRLHIPYSQAAASILEGLRMRAIALIRDPRDVVCSQIDHILRDAGHQFHGLYAAASPGERLIMEIRGFRAPEPRPQFILDIDTRVRSVLAWGQCGFATVTRFEVLLGDGGRRTDEQVAEMSRIVGHLGITAPRHELAWIAENLFGGTATFRRGRIGGWSEEFTDDARTAFKEVAGPLLVELGYERDADW